MCLEAGFFELLHAELFSYILLQFVKVKLRRAGCHFESMAKAVWCFDRLLPTGILQVSATITIWRSHAVTLVNLCGLLSTVCYVIHPAPDKPRPWRRHNFTRLLLLTVSLWLKKD